MQLERLGYENASEDKTPIFNFWTRNPFLVWSRLQKTYFPYENDYFPDGGLFNQPYDYPNQ